MSYAVPALFYVGGIAFSLERPSFLVDSILLKGFPNHPQSLWRGLPLVMIHSATQSQFKKRPPPKEDGASFGIILSSTSPKNYTKIYIKREAIRTRIIAASMSA